MNAGCHYFDAILASTGMNKNREFFAAQPLWDARNNCVDEPLNFNHEEFKIIGHITAYAIGKGQPNTDEFEILDDPDWDDVKDGFHLITKAALYRDYWREEEQIMYIEKLIEEMSEGKWYVSLECVPDSFDFVLIKDGIVKIVEFNDQTAFLAKHLVQYEGSGEFNGYQLGRLLKNFKFVGKGLVRNPANPTSVILSSEKQMENKADSNAAQELEAVKAELVSAKQVAANKSAEVSALTASIKTLNDEKATLEADKTALVASVETLTQELTQVKASVEVLKNEKVSIEKTVGEKDTVIAGLNTEISSFKNSTRVEKLVAAGLEKEKAEGITKTLIALDEEGFNLVLSSYKKSEATPPTIEETVQEVPGVVLATSATNEDRLNELKQNAVSFFSTGDK